MSAKIIPFVNRAVWLTHTDKQQKIFFEDRRVIMCGHRELSFLQKNDMLPWKCIHCFTYYRQFRFYELLYMISKELNIHTTHLDILKSNYQKYTEGKPMEPNTKTTPTNTNTTTTTTPPTQKLINPRNNKEYFCPVEAAIDVIGGKWKPLILWQLKEEKVIRYNRLQQNLHGVSPRMLTKQLRELEEDGLVHREMYPEIPPRVEYSLTEFGTTVSPIIESLCEWGYEYLEQQRPPEEEQ